MCIEPQTIDKQPHIPRQNPAFLSRSHSWVYPVGEGGRGLPYERDGDARRKCWIKHLKEDNLGVAFKYHSKTCISIFHRVQPETRP